MSRPSELLRVISSDSKFGIIIKDIQFIKCPDDSSYALLSIRSFKNQSSRKIYKRIIIGDSRCHHIYISGTSSVCPCNYINPFKLLKLILYRQAKMDVDPSNKFKMNSKFNSLFR